jgi:hypothetical protein
MHTLTRALRFVLFIGLLGFLVPGALAHGVGSDDLRLLTAGDGARPAPFMYLGAKHMVTGYDHLLFLAGVIFFLLRLRDVALYVTLFAVGHSITLLWGILGGIRADAHIVDAIIGLSVVYKAFDNLGGLRMMHIPLDARAAVFAFGLAHGFGLSTKLQDAGLAADGLLPNMLAFNVGVELGQLAALSAIVIAFAYWRRTANFAPGAVIANVLLMAAGFTLFGSHVAGYVLG